MAKRAIRLNGDELLRKKARPVKDFSPSLATLLEDMAETMYAAEGAGIAGPQVGILRQVIVIDIGEGKIELVNPEILEAKGSQIGAEGCLSIPGKSARVERPYYMRVRAQDRQGKPFEIEGEGFLAVALSHEIDHLSGVLYIDKALPDEDEGEEEETL